MAEHVQFPNPRFRDFHPPVDTSASPSLSSSSPSSSKVMSTLALDHVLNGTNSSSCSQQQHTDAAPLYVPIDKPPTPAPSPRPPSPLNWYSINNNRARPASTSFKSGADPLPVDPIYRAFCELFLLEDSEKIRLLMLVLRRCIRPLLRRFSTYIEELLACDILSELPLELAIYIIDLVDDERTLANASQVCKFWQKLVNTERVWKRMFELNKFELDEDAEKVWKAMCERNRARINGLDAASSGMGQMGVRVGGLQKMDTYEDARRLSCGTNDDLELDGTQPMFHAQSPLIYTNTSKATLSSSTSTTAVSFSSATPSGGVVSGTITPTSTPSTPTPLTPISGDPSASSRFVWYKKQFEKSYITRNNWKKGGRLINKHRPPNGTANPDGGVVTSVAIDCEHIIVGLASARIQVFSAKTGVLSRTLTGHESGVWAVNLVQRGGRWANAPPLPGPSSSTSPGSSSDDFNHLPTHTPTETNNILALAEIEQHFPQTLRTAIGLDRPRPAHDPAFDLEVSKKPSDVCFASEGWGQANALVVSGGCDKELRVWDIKSGYCIYILRGHTSTIRCLRVLHNRPIAVSGSRDTTLRVWDVQRGRLLRTLTGHDESVRCLDVCGNRAVSGSYDCTCRLWNVDTGECLYVLRGHYHQIYSVAFDGKYIASGGLDTTVRIWDPDTGKCLALLQGHTALVCQMQLSNNTLATGGSDGRVIIFSLSDMSIAKRLAAHDSSVTALQFDSHFLVTAGNDGRVRLHDADNCGRFIRELTDRADSVWKVAFRRDKCAIMCRRNGKTVMEIWSFRPSEADD